MLPAPWGVRYATSDSQRLTDVALAPVGLSTVRERRLAGHFHTDPEKYY
jgi:hypothetical protein